MWESGPLRQFSESCLGGYYIRVSSPFLTGYAGSYVCDECLRPSAGVLCVPHVSKWLCGRCKKQALHTGGCQ